MSDEQPAVTREDDFAALDAIQECVASGGGAVAPEDLKAVMLAIECAHDQTLRGARLMSLVACSDAMADLVAAGVERRHAARALSVELFMAASFLTLATKRLDGEAFSPARLALYVYHLSKGLADSEPWSETVELADLVAAEHPGRAAETGAAMKLEAATHRAIQLITDERWRQVTDEGWSREHDDGYTRGELAKAAAAYALYAVRPENDRRFRGAGDPPPEWRWAAQWWKPKDPVADLVRAGALIIAELERLQRQSDAGA